MSTTTTSRRPGHGSPSASSNGHGTHSPTMVAPPMKRVRLPELAIGLFVVVLFALGAVLWHLSSVEKSPALALGGPVERGETITADDVRVVDVASDDALATLGETQLNEIVGRVALVDLPAGTLLTKGVVTDPVAIGEGDGVAGLSLDPGQYPALGIAPGDVVNVVAAVDQPGSEDGAEVDRVIARSATVFAVEDLSGDRKLISIMASEADAEAVASAAGSGTLRLVLVAP